MKKSDKYILDWLDKKYNGSKDLGDWTPKDVSQLLSDYTKESIPMQAVVILQNTITKKINKCEKILIKSKKTDTPVFLRAEGARDILNQLLGYLTNKKSVLSK